MVFGASKANLSKWLVFCLPLGCFLDHLWASLTALSCFFSANPGFSASLGLLPAFRLLRFPS